MKKLATLRWTFSVAEPLKKGPPECIKEFDSWTSSRWVATDGDVTAHCTNSHNRIDIFFQSYSTEINTRGLNVRVVLWVSKSTELSETSILSGDRRKWAPLFSLSILHALKIRDCYALSVRNDRQGPSEEYVRLALKNLGGTLNPIQSTVLNPFHSNQTGTFNPPCSKKILFMS